MNPKAKLIIELIWFGIVIIGSVIIFANFLSGRESFLLGLVGVLAFIGSVDRFAERWAKL